MRLEAAGLLAGSLALTLLLAPVAGAVPAGDDPGGTDSTRGATYATPGDDGPTSDAAPGTEVADEGAGSTVEADADAVEPQAREMTPSYGDGDGSGGSDDRGSDDHRYGGDPAQVDAPEAVPDPLPDADVEASEEAPGATADAEVLTDHDCRRGRLMGVTVGFTEAPETAPGAVPWDRWFEGTTWYWGVDDPWDDAIECLDPTPEAADANPLAGRLPGGAAGPHASPSGASLPADGAGTAVPADDPVVEDEEPEPGQQPVVNAAGFTSPVHGSIQASPAALALAALAVPVAVALYRRLTQDNLLENDTRREILELVLDRPGVTTAEVSEILDIHYRTARHHLEKLREFDKIAGLRIHGRIRYFENHERFGRIQKRLISSLDSETKQEILMEVARTGALGSGEIAERVDVAPSTASHHLGDLEEQDLVEARRDGRSVIYSLRDGVLPALLELGPDPGGEDSTIA